MVVREWAEQTSTLIIACFVYFPSLNLNYTYWLYVTAWVRDIYLRVGMYVCRYVGSAHLQICTILQDECLHTYI